MIQWSVQGRARPGRAELVGAEKGIHFLVSGLLLARPTERHKARNFAYALALDGR
jgi:hypothetical protein